MVASTADHGKEAAEGDKAGAGPKADEPKLEGPELLEAIKKQVEYYFSKENLMQDSFLVSKMDKEYYVDLSVLADFHLLKVLTTEEKLIVEAIKSSKKIAMDEAHKKVRPVNINARTTLILRNIPSATPVADVTAFLEKAKLPATVSIHSDVGDNWFASFENEDAAKTALEAAKGLKWEDKTIGCALKSENLLKGITPGVAPSSGGGTGGGSVPGFYVPMQYPYGYQFQQGDGEGGAMGGGRGQGGRRGQGRQGAANGADGEGQKKGPKKGKGRGGREGGRDGRDGNSGDNSSSAAAQQPPINLSDFPSLGATGAKNGAGADGKSVAGEGEKRSDDAAERKGVDGANGAHSNNEQPAGPASTGESSAAPAASGTVNAKSAADSAGASQPKKLSYAQMAQAQAAAVSPSNATD